MDDSLTRLTAILLNALISLTGTLLFLLELYLAKKFVDELKLELFFKRATALVRFILALIVAALAFQLLNAYPSKYLGILFSASPPLTKLLTLAEAVIFFALLYRLFKKSAGDGSGRGPVASGPLPKQAARLRRSWEEEE